MSTQSNGTTAGVTLVRDGAIAVLTLDRQAKLNTLTPEMAQTLFDYVEQCNRDDGIRAVVLTGAGQRAFCAGSDIGELDRYDGPWAFRNRVEYCDVIRSLRKPVIAAVNGYAFGGGLEIALSCDIRLASDHASFAAPEIKLGWIGGGGVASLLAHAIGQSNASLMLMTGEAIDAARALQWGLVSETVSADGLLARACELAHTIASRAPIAAETAKANLNAAFNMPRTQAIAYERDLQTVCFATADAMEGREAFAQKRPPVFNKR